MSSASQIIIMGKTLSKRKCDEDLEKVEGGDDKFDKLPFLLWKAEQEMPCRICPLILPLMMTNGIAASNFSLSSPSLSSSSLLIEDG